MAERERFAFAQRYALPLDCLSQRRRRVVGFSDATATLAPVSPERSWHSFWFNWARGAAGMSLTLVSVSCALPGGSGAPPASQGSSAHAICNRGTYLHIPGDFPEFGPPQTLYVGTTPDGHGSIFRVEAPPATVTYFYAAGAGRLTTSSNCERSPLMGHTCFDGSRVTSTVAAL